ncbi:MAG TPA: alginate export family protein, partial [Usitatibacter sp.]|nr:alginate export family protein [Usitatibacter sp.]
MNIIVGDSLDIAVYLRETGAMGRGTRSLIVAPLLALPALGAGAADDIGNTEMALADAFRAGRFHAELRPRYNRIDEDDKPLRTEGFTSRAVLGWRSAPYRGLRLTIEGLHTGPLGAKRFNDDGAQIASSPYPLLPDPRYTGWNQVHAEYTGIDSLRLRLGRQQLRIDNERWVSDNDFRQVPQLFDGVRAVYTGVANAELDAGYFTHMRTTSGMTRELRLATLRAAWNPLPGHSLGAYGVFHDQAQNGAFTGFADNSYRVLGVRAEGAFAAGPVDVPYVLEAAQQRPYAGGDSRVHAVYVRAGAGVSTSQFTVRYDYEVKGSNRGQYGLQMPLTDFYAFNGWTLHFFNTPRQGLRDGWITARHRWNAFTLYAEGHRFRSDFGGIDFGREVDAGLTYAWHENVVVRLQ